MKLETLIALILLVIQGSLLLAVTYLVVLGAKYLDRHSEELQTMNVKFLRLTKKPNQPAAKVFEDFSYMTDEELAEKQIDDFKKKGYSNDDIQKAMYGDLL